VTVDGAETLAYAQLIQAYLDAAISNGTLDVAFGTGNGAGKMGFGPASPDAINYAVLSSNEEAGVGIGATATVPQGYQALFDNVNGATTVIGSNSGIEAIFAGQNSAATYVDNGGNNLIDFVDGNNRYDGDQTSTATYDTIAAGTGFDTINTGAGHATVFADAGNTNITLNDSIRFAGSSYNSGFNDYVYLQYGYNTVFANGLFDVVVADAAAQTIHGGTSSADYNAFVLNPDGGNDAIYGDAATVSVFNFSNGNSIFGGSGKLTFVGETGSSASIYSGNGTSLVFASAGDSITWVSDSSHGVNDFIGGEGSETLNGSAAQAGLVVFGYANTFEGIDNQISDYFIGGSGNDTLVSGAGHETMMGGAGANTFVIAATPDSVGGEITLGDFGSSELNTIVFANFSAAQVDAALANAHVYTVVPGESGVTFTLSDNTTVNVVGVTSLNGHILIG